MRLLWRLMFGMTVLPLPVWAASFDCKLATSPMDKLICQSRDLSDLDVKLAEIYGKKRNQLSPEGGRLLRSSERSWLHYMRTVCRLSPGSSVNVQTPATECVKMLYQERLSQLGEVAQKRGPFLFNQIDLYASEPDGSDNDGGGAPGFYTQHLSYPQIDQPKSPDVDVWNKIYNEGDAGPITDCDGSNGDGETTYNVSYAGRHVISVEWSSSTYCHGTPHGFFSVGGENRVWDQMSRTLVPADIFSDGWAPKLQSLFWNALVSKGWKPQDESAKDGVLAVVIQPQKWVFTEDGLSVSFGAYEGGCYACNPGTTTVKWTDLKPLLSAHSLVP